jgi:hypothetical protein
MTAMNGLARLAGIWSNDPAFQRWVAEQLRVDEANAEECADYIRIVCEVHSRRDLDISCVAAALFQTHIRRPFMAWRNRYQSQRRAA